MAAPEMSMCVSVHVESVCVWMYILHVVCACVCVCVCVCVHVCMTVGSSCGSTDNTSVHSSITYHLQLGIQWKLVSSCMEKECPSAWAWAVLG